MNNKRIIKYVKIGLLLLVSLFIVLLYKSINAQENIYTTNDLHSDSLYEDENFPFVSMKLSSSDLSLLYKSNDWISIEVLEGTKSYSAFIKQSTKGDEAYNVKIGDELYTLYNANNETISKLVYINMLSTYNIEGSKPTLINLSFNEVDMGKYILEESIIKQERDNDGNYYISLDMDTMLTRQIKYNIDSQFDTAIDFFETKSLCQYIAINKLLGNNENDNTLFIYNNEEKKLIPYITMDTCPNYTNKKIRQNEDNELSKLYSFHRDIRNEVDDSILQMIEKDKLINNIEDWFNKYRYNIRTDSVVKDIKYTYNEKTKELVENINQYKKIRKNEKKYKHKFYYDGHWKYIEASHGGGFYTDEFQLKLSTIEGCEIYYTLDGSYPTNKSNIYKKPISIENKSSEEDNLALISNTSLVWKKPKTNSFKGTVVRSIVYYNDKPISNVMTQSYFIDKNIDNRYSFPVVSIVTDKENFFDYVKGIYVLGRRRNYWLANNKDKPINNGTSANYTARGRAWERPVHIEWFEEDGKLGFSQNLGARMNGGWSRSFPMKPIKLYARSEYDDNKKITYNIFDDLKDADGNNIDTFKTFLLRNSGHDFQYTMFEDAMIHSLMKGTHVNTQAYKPVIVFINGEYWGIHNARERQDKNYLNSHYNVDEEDIILLENKYRLLHGNEGDESRYVDIIEYLKKNDIRDKDIYDYIETKIDIDNYIDYYILETYVANLDWLTNNVKFWCKRTDGYVENAEYGHDGKFRWLLFDTEGGFNYYDYNMITHTTEVRKTPGSDWANFLFRTLLRNSEFRNKYLVRYADLLNTNFREEEVISKIDEMKANLHPMMEEHINRWGYPSSMDRWSKNVDGIKEFAQKRPDVIRKNLSNYFGIKIIKGELSLSDANGGHIEVNGIKVNINDNKSFTGYYFQGLPISIKVIVNDGYEFDGFEGVEGKGDVITITPDEEFNYNAIVREKISK